MANGDQQKDSKAKTPGGHNKTVECRLLTFLLNGKSLLYTHGTQKVDQPIVGQSTLLGKPQWYETRMCTYVSKFW